MMNVEFLKKEGVTHIVNTAKGLEIFGPKYTVSEGQCPNVYKPNFCLLYTNKQYAKITLFLMGTGSSGVCQEGAEVSLS